MVVFVVDLLFFCAFSLVASLTISLISVSDESIPTAEDDSSNVLDSSVLKFFEFAALGCSNKNRNTWNADFASSHSELLLEIGVSKKLSISWKRPVKEFIFSGLQSAALLKMNSFTGIFSSYHPFDFLNLGTALLLWLLSRLAGFTKTFTDFFIKSC